MRNTPAQAEFHMPAEWERHEGTWLQWPHDNTHSGQQVRLENIWLMMTETLHQHEAVHRRCSQAFQQVDRDRMMENRRKNAVVQI